MRRGDPDKWVDFDELCPVDDLSTLQYHDLIENRGGCRCFQCAPCSACSEALEIEELENLGLPVIRTSTGAIVYLGNPDDLEEPDMTPSNIVKMERKRR